MTNNANPPTEKEDCELKAFQRLSSRLKKEFPRLAICLVADALYCGQAVVAACQLFDWKYILTIKEDRQPTTWQETIKCVALVANSAESSQPDPVDNLISAVRHICTACLRVHRRITSVASLQPRSRSRPAQGGIRNRRTASLRRDTGGPYL